jgi:ribosomal-protein-serine acetyltransferase
MKFKSKIIGQRIILKMTKPNLKTAKEISSQINKDLNHLDKWLDWVNKLTTLENTLQFLHDKEKEVNENKKVEYGVYLNNKYIGHIAILNIDLKNKSGEIGYWISSDLVNKGYITEAVKIIEKDFFKVHKFNKLQILCDKKNIPSITVAKKCGYKKRGVLRKDYFSPYFNEYRYTMVLSKLLSEYKA